MIIEAQQVHRHSVSTGDNVFTLLPGVNVRYDDAIHYAGRKYSVTRIQRLTDQGAAVVLATYRGKL